MTNYQRRLQVANSWYGHGGLAGDGGLARGHRWLLPPKKKPPKRRRRKIVTIVIGAFAGVAAADSGIVSKAFCAEIIKRG
jgi:hypothetical protein